jgi:hypothetical protein
MRKAQAAHNRSTTDNPCQNPLARDRRFLRFESRVGFEEIGTDNCNIAGLNQPQAKRHNGRCEPDRIYA